ncbi:MAG: tRNA (guanosine(46)-N7)-methyltransferase TrmB [Myxococcota bacterium]
MSRRVRKHANPFNVVTRLDRLDRSAQFGREAPIEVDVGCGAGDFLLQRARARPDLDFVGFEIRKPLVEAANARALGAGLRNVVFFYANAHENLSFAEPGWIQRFCVQFPDPCFKKRHWKRRILQPFFVREMSLRLPTGGEIFAQSDVQPLAEEMFVFLSAETSLKAVLPDTLDAPNPFDERTEWERQHEREGEPVYRMLFRKVGEPEGPVPDLEFRNTNPRTLDDDATA